jgi:hypothetical protein
MAGASRSGRTPRKGPRSQEVKCFEGRGKTLEDAVQNAVKLIDTRRRRNAVVYDLQVKVLVGNPITDYIVQLSPPGS